MELEQNNDNVDLEKVEQQKTGGIKRRDILKGIASLPVFGGFLCSRRRCGADGRFPRRCSARR